LNCWFSFHGQAAVEAGFIVNKHIFVDNLHEDTVVAQRVVFSAMQYYGGMLKVPLTAGLLQSVRSSSHRRRLAVEASKQKHASEATSKKRKAALELQLSAI